MASVKDHTCLYDIHKNVIRFLFLFCQEPSLSEKKNGRKKVCVYIELFFVCALTEIATSRYLTPALLGTSWSRCMSYY